MSLIMALYGMAGWAMREGCSSAKCSSTTRQVVAWTRAWRSRPSDRAADVAETARPLEIGMVCPLRSGPP